MKQRSKNKIQAADILVRRIIQKVKKNSEQHKYDLFPVMHFPVVIECNLSGCTFYMVLRVGEVCLTDLKSFILFELFVTYKPIPFCILLLKSMILLVLTYFIFPS